MNRLVPTFAVVSLAALMGAALWMQVHSVPTTLDDFFLPGSQPNESGQLETPQKCDNCHGGYDQAVEPAFAWRGSMMSQAARDPLFYAAMAVANQDAPDSGDLCIRCHSPAGWLEGRSLPTDGSALNNNDRESVQCDFCHKLVAPTSLGVNPYPDDPDYTGMGTYDQDQLYLSSLSSVIPPASANGMYVADASNAKRGPFTDAQARHKMYYSPFHQDAALCGTCHDVSNPAFMRVGELKEDGTYDYVANNFGEPAPDFDPYMMFPVERTYSEWFHSAYNTPEGVYAPQFGGNKTHVSTCQDCHMRDVTGVAANKKGSVHRDDLPLHDMTGGNTFIPPLIEALFPGETDPAALAAGVERARGMLRKAATLEAKKETEEGVEKLEVKVTNETGHKLPSGYPEGRRIWINVQFKNASGEIVQERGAYDAATAELSTGDTKVYEIKPGIAGVGESFHFVLNNTIIKDNRIPPRGFTNAAFKAIQSPPVGYAYDDGDYYDETYYSIPDGATQATVTLYYQTTSKEYVEFLRDENRTNHWGRTLYDLWSANGKSAPEMMAQTTVDLGNGGGTGGTAPAAAFTASPTSGPAPLAVSFTNESTNADAYSWTFGDGGSSAETNPSHTYSSAGTYTVSLTATNAYGSDTATETITVTEPGGGTTLRVASIAVGRETKGPWTSGTAAVTVVDQGDAPVQGVVVSGYFNEPSTAMQQNTTDGSGVASFTSDRTRGAVGSFCFTVTGLVLDGVSHLDAPVSTCEGGALQAADASTLEQNHPNPFNPTTQIPFTLRKPAHVRLTVYNLAGQLVATLIDRPLEAGTYAYPWSGDDVPSGVYLYALLVDDQVSTRTMTLMK